MSRVTEVVARWAILAVVVALASTPLVGCADGCASRREVRELLGQLPADVDFAAALELSALLDGETAPLALDKVGRALGVELGAFRDFVGQLEAIAYLRRTRPANDHDCERAADHVLRLMSEQVDGRVIPAERRAGVVDSCRAMGTASCLLEARDMVSATRCMVVGQARGRIEVAVVLLGSFDPEQLTTTIAAELGLRVASGVPRYADRELAATPLADLGVAIGGPELVRAVHDSISGAAPRLRDGGTLSEALAGAESDAAAVAVYPSAGAPAIGGAISLRVGADVELDWLVLGGEGLQTFVSENLVELRRLFEALPTARLEWLAGNTVSDDATAREIAGTLKTLVSSTRTHPHPGGVKMSMRYAVPLRDFARRWATSEPGEAYARFQRMLRTDEAVDNLARIFRGAMDFLTRPRGDADQPEACRFPETVECTPPEGSPCDHPGQRYPASAKAWRKPTWMDLRFHLAGPHRYRYCFESSGVLGAARFTATAYGDLDCDGEWSTFQRSGFADPGSSLGGCLPGDAPALFMERPLE